MKLFQKRTDPLSNRARQLTAEIARLETEIEHLASRKPSPSSGPRFRSTARNGTVVTTEPSMPAFSGPLTVFPAATPSPGPAPVQPTSAVPPADPRYNELGVKKYDLAAGWQRLVNSFSGPTSTNPKMLSFLAAGSIHGLRPLRYERRIARRRFLALFALLFAVLWGLAFVYFRQR